VHEIRPMTSDDIDAAADSFNAAFVALRAAQGLPPAEHTDADHRRQTARIRHYLGTDPDGSFVAVVDGAVAGMSQSFVREGHWMLSMLGLAPVGQGKQVGYGLLEASLDLAPRDSRGSIQASRDPRAMALYSRAGFDMHPTVCGHGPLRRRPAMAPSIRVGGLDDLALVGAVDREVRGAARDVDITFALEQGCTLYLDDAGGYALGAPDRVISLAARTDAIAGALLDAVLAQSEPGVTVEVNWLTAGQGWAIRKVVEYGIDLRIQGPMMIRGLPGPPAPYIASGGMG
jgi:GNAT superfamily N-acetyltransferase